VADRVIPISDNSAKVHARAREIKRQARDCGLGAALSRNGSMTLYLGGRLLSLKTLLFSLPAKLSSRSLTGRPPIPMSIIRPAANLDLALREFRRAVGDAYVKSDRNECDGYLDEYAVGLANSGKIAGIVQPASADEIQAIVRIALEYKVPIWPISRGKNLGYGSSEPVTLGSVVLDLGRMNRILNIDERFAYCELEPGVSFFDLFDCLQKNKIPLWPSAPGHGWGSVIGNALERGLGYTPYGNHASKLCGLEVVLADGSLIRTGMGAMNGSRCWHHCQYGFGPSWDQMFLQSNLGIVTRAGVWLMPEPEATLRARINVPAFEDLSSMVDAIAPLRLRNIIEHPVVIGNHVHEAAVFTRRNEWYQGTGSVPNDVLTEIMRASRAGQWNASVMLYGYPEVIRAHSDIVARALESTLKQETRFDLWTRGEPIEGSAASIPGNEGLRMAKWYGASGGHIDLSPVLPPDGKVVLNRAQETRRRYEEFGFDYCASFILGHRHVTNVNTILFDRDNPLMIANTKSLFRVLITDCAREGFGLYRTHIDFMEEVAKTFDFNDQAMIRLNEIIKKAIDPERILAPGKNGIGGRT
jgi:4-cresol dehydrogenase (hydroxylating)